MSISTVLLSYNEAENIRVLLPQIIEQLKKTSEKYEILVIDSEKSSDDTKSICQEYDDVRYIIQRYDGFGGAFKTGIEEARYDKFLIMDSDGSHDPRYITDIYNKFIDGADIVIGSRYTYGGQNNDSKVSVIMSLVLNAVFRIIIGVKARDISTDYRMYRTQDLKETNLKCRNYDVLQEVILQLKVNSKNTLKIKEVPIVFEKRMFGNSKRRLLSFIISYIKNCFSLLKYRVEHSR